MNNKERMERIDKRFEENANERFDLTAADISMIHDLFPDAWNRIVESFKFGYLQGMRAAQKGA